MLKLEKLKKGEKVIINKILELFENLKWDDKFAYKRKRGADGSPNIIADSRMNIYKKESKKPIKAMVLGKVRAYHTPNLVSSTATKKKKHIPIFKLLKKLIKLHNPKFKWTSIQINNKVKTVWHFDKNNVGYSYCLGIGDFTKGGIDVKINNKIVNYDNHNQWLYYNGKEIEHRTAKFKGVRYAIIYYNLKKNKKKHNNI